jgi:excisionase family DNA binding protein
MSDRVHDARSTRRGHDGGEPTTDWAEPLLRPEAVARLLSCSPKTVYAWAASGLIPSVRLGRLVRFRSVDVWRFIEAHAEARKGGVHGSGLS